MDFIADENIDGTIVEALRSSGHQVRYIAEVDSGANDEQIFQNANDSNAILITADKDFGEIVFRQKRVTSGVILIRLCGLTPQAKADLVLAIVEEHKADLNHNFTVIAPGIVRIRRSLQ